MTAFFKEKWEELSEEELARSRRSFLAFTTSLEEGNMREQFRASMDPMLNLQDVVGSLRSCFSCKLKFFDYFVQYDLALNLALFDVINCMVESDFIVL